MAKDMWVDVNVKDMKIIIALGLQGLLSYIRKGVPEQTVHERTGHRSLTGLCHYGRTSVVQEHAIGFF